MQTPLEKKLGADWKTKCINKYGSKMACLVEYLHNLFENSQNRVIIFSQYDKMLKMIGKTLDEFSIKFVYCQGNNFVLNKNINKFKKDDSIRVIMLSSETSNSGSNLTEANYIIFIDVLFQDQHHVKATEAQAIGRAVRLGQKLPVKVVRFITRGTIEDEHFQKNRYDMNSLQE
jgi:SNF2 family DNA or RNA helicase